MDADFDPVRARKEFPRKVVAELDAIEAVFHERSATAPISEYPQLFYEFCSARLDAYAREAWFFLGYPDGDSLFRELLQTFFRTDIEARLHNETTKRVCGPKARIEIRFRLSAELARWNSNSAKAHLNVIARSEKENPTAGDAQAQGSTKNRKVKKPARRNDRQEGINNALREVAAARPKSHQEVFRLLHDRKVPIPNAKVFKSAGGWLKGFQQNRHLASAWLSQAWKRLSLPAFSRGPKE